MLAGSHIPISISQYLSLSLSLSFSLSPNYQTMICPSTSVRGSSNGRESTRQHSEGTRHTITQGDDVNAAGHVQLTILHMQMFNHCPTQHKFDEQIRSASSQIQQIQQALTWTVIACHRDKLIDSCMSSSLHRGFMTYMAIALSDCINIAVCSQRRPLLNIQPCTRD